MSSEPSFNLIGILWIAGILLCLCNVSRAHGRTLRMDGAARQYWSFIGGAWEENEDRIITPPEVSVDENLAFYTAEAYADFEAEFEFRWDNVICGAGLIFRAQDARHYYLVHFPCTGQQYRAEHFWAAISKVDDPGWVKVLKMQMVPGVPSEIGLWHHVRLVVKGNEIRLWVDGRPFPTVRDGTYTQSGYIGLESYSGTAVGARSSFRGLRISGEVVEAEPWDDTLQPPQNWFYPSPETTYGNCQTVSSITRAPGGDLLMRLAAGHEFHGQEWTPLLIRSTDNGRSWSPQEKLPDIWSAGGLHTTRDGRLLRLNISSERPCSIVIATSEDNGKSWSEFEECGKVDLPFDHVYANCAPLELQDGTLVWFMFARTTEDIHFPYYDGAWYGACYCIRSTDGGRSWSAPVNIDGPNPRPDCPMYKLIASEVSAAETREGKIIALIRSFWNPTMWECWSEDGGVTWRPAARGPFPMWACSQIVRTASGVLLIGGRHPGLAIEASFDDGMTWQCYRIDTPFYANGTMYEVEPDVVIFVYHGKYSDPRTRAQLIRVTPQGLEPVRVTPPQ